MTVQPTLSEIIADMLAYERHSFDDLCEECDGAGVRTVTLGDRNGTEVTEKCEECDGSGKAERDLSVSGADLVDAFTEWREQLKAALPELERLQRVAALAPDLADSLEEAAIVHVWGDDTPSEDCGYLAVVQGMRDALAGEDAAAADPGDLEEEGNALPDELGHEDAAGMFFHVRANFADRAGFLTGHAFKVWARTGNEARELVWPVLEQHGATKIDLHIH